MKFYDKGGVQRIDVAKGAIALMRRLAKDAIPNETGGILIGNYDETHRAAIVSHASGPPSDSIAGPWSFRRGMEGLDRILARAWKRGTFYIGEWHFHPEAWPRASPTDMMQMRTFASDAAMNCPEPVLLIVGLPAAGGRVAGYRFAGSFEQFRSED
jgi:integrative and conjugative element protein (TIGR02256 family)